MTAAEVRMPAIVPWGLFFVPGVLFVVVDIMRLNITGLFVVGVVFLALWLWLIGGLTGGFWVQRDPADEATGLDVLEQEGHR